MCKTFKLFFREFLRDLSSSYNIFAECNILKTYMHVRALQYSILLVFDMPSIVQSYAWNKMCQISLNILKIETLFYRRSENKNIFYEEMEVVCTAKIQHEYNVSGKNEVCRTNIGQVECRKRNSTMQAVKRTTTVVFDLEGLKMVRRDLVRVDYDSDVSIPVFLHDD